MKVEELKRLLENYSDDFDVILQKDAEGNGCSPLEGVDNAYYEAKTTWYGECRNATVDCSNCIVLYPVN